MSVSATARRRLLSAGAAVIAIGAIAGCAGADKTATSHRSMAGMNMSNTGGSGAGAVAGSDSSMPGMTMSASGTGTATIVNSQGIATPVPIQTIGTGSWKDMSIQAQTMTPVPFYVYDGSGFREMKPGKHASFHLMVMLSDERTGQPLPYATVWAEIYKGKKEVYNERQWDMLSEYMGPHYGNDVTLPGAGRYTLKLLVSAPVAALHIEYANMWKGTHTVVSTFNWKPPASS